MTHLSRATCRVASLSLFSALCLGADPNAQSSYQRNGLSELGTPCIHTQSKKVGTNLSLVQYYISSIANADLSKRGQVWLDADGNGNTGGGGPVMSDTNDKGQPLERSVSRIFVPGYEHPTNTSGNPYILTYDTGTSTATVLTDIELRGLTITEISSTTVGTTTTKKYTAGISPTSDLIKLFVKTINSDDLAADPTGNAVDLKLSLWVDQAHMDAHAADPEKIFFDKYIQRLNDLDPGLLATRSTWSRANFAGSGGNQNSWSADWTQRTEISDARYSAAEGVPWEMAAWIANEVQADLWVCIPFVAFDPTLDRTDPNYARAEDYVRGMAALLKTELDSDRHIYVEWSNEIWNPIFPTQQFLQGFGNTLAQQNAAVDIMEKVFGEWWLDEWNDCRVNFVTMGKTADVSWATVIGTQLEAMDLCDDVGCSWYMIPLASDVDVWQQSASNDPTPEEVDDSVFSSVDDSVSGLTFLLNAHGALADSLDVGFMTYEGGHSLVTNRPWLQATYGTYQHDKFGSGTRDAGDVLTHAMDRFFDATNSPLVGDTTNYPSQRFVDLGTYHSFCQGQDEVNGDFLLITDMYAGEPLALVDQEVQYKFEAVKAYNAVH